MLDKLALHNSIQKNKKYVQQAKVNIISKLVHKLRKLNKLKEENNSEDDKLKAKISKKLEVLAHLKKFKGFQLLKEGLLYKKNPQVVLTNGHAPAEDLAYAMLFAYKKVSQIIKTLKETFNLNDDDSSWREIVMEFGKKRKSTHLKSIRNNQNAESNKKFNMKNENNNKTEIETANKAHQSEKKTSIKYEKRSSVTKSKKEIVNEFPPSKPTQETIDPFFVTNTGENYLSTVTVGPDSDISEDKRKTQWTNKSFTKNEDRFGVQKPQFKRQINPAARSNPSKFRNTNLPLSRQRENTDMSTSKWGGNTSSKTPATEENLEDLHPSWKAKKNLKPIIAEFKGKKVVFNDDDD